MARFANLPERFGIQAGATHQRAVYIRLRQELGGVAGFDAPAVLNTQGLRNGRTMFLLDDPGPLVDEALRVLKPDNELVVLTPTGVGDPSAAVATLPTGSNGRLRNAMVHVW